jgi:HK97 family phage major capsid protein/HK97 family phage prohead protease
MDGLVYRAAKQSEADPREFVLSDESVDRYGEIINVDGWDLSEFKADRNPVALFNHNANAIIGHWENVRVVGKRLLAKIVFGSTQVAKDARSDFEEGHLRAASVGFRPIEKEPINEKADEYFGPFRYLRQQLVECSLVAVPANANALHVSRSFALPADASRQLFGKLAKEDPTTRVALTGKLARPLPTGKTSMKTPILTKQIENQQTDLNRLRDQLNSLISVEERDDAQQTLFTQLPSEIEASKTNLNLLLAAEKALGFEAAETRVEDLGEPQQVAIADRRPFAMPKKKIEPADYCFRAAAAGLRAASLRVPVEQVVREVYGSDEATQIITRAAVNPATTTVTGYAAELVQTGFGAFLDRLIANSIYAPLSAAGTRYDLGRNGSLKIPYRATTPLASGAWVLEGAPKPVKRIGLAVVELKPHKISCITTYTEEMANSSVPAIETILRKAMADDTQASLDGFLIDAVAESAGRPAGLLVGVSPITASAAATSLEKIVADINALIAPMEAAGGGNNIALLMNPAQSRRIGMAATTTGDFAFGSAAEAASKFGASRIISSTTIPSGRVIAVDADWFATATGDLPRFNVSDQATIHEEDTTPLALGTGVQGSGVLAVPQRSLWQTDSIGVRLSLYVTWAMVRTGMVQTIASVGW